MHLVKCPSKILLIELMSWDSDLFLCISYKGFSTQKEEEEEEEGKRNRILNGWKKEQNPEFIMQVVIESFGCIELFMEYSDRRE